MTNNHLFYYKKLQLHRISYSLLLGIHWNAGNHTRVWVSYLMNRFVVAVRNNIRLLDVSLVIIHLRKAIQAVYSKVCNRGTLLIYVQTINSIQITYPGTFTYVTDWMGGILTNYRYLMHLINLQQTILSLTGPFIHRDRYNATLVAQHKGVPAGLAVKIGKTSPLSLAPIPSISFSLREGFIWLNECNSLGIPSVQLCDTTSRFDKISYPIICNQEAFGLANVITHLFTEVCSMGLLKEHLLFRSLILHYNSARRSIKDLVLKRRKRNKNKKVYASNKRICYRFLRLNLMSTGPFGLYKQLQNYSFGINNQSKRNQTENILDISSETNTLILSKKITDRMNFLSPRNRGTFYVFLALKQLMATYWQTIQRILIRLSLLKKRLFEFKAGRKYWSMNCRKLFEGLLKIMESIMPIYVDRIQQIIRKRIEHAPFVTLIRIQPKDVPNIHLLLFIHQYAIYQKIFLRIRRVHILLLGILMLNIKSLPLRLPLMLRQQEKSKKK